MCAQEKVILFFEICFICKYIIKTKLATKYLKTWKNNKFIHFAWFLQGALIISNQMVAIMWSSTANEHAMHVGNMKFIPLPVEKQQSNN